SVSVERLRGAERAGRVRSSCRDGSGHECVARVGLGLLPGSSPLPGAMPGVLRSRREIPEATASSRRSRRRSQCAPIRYDVDLGQPRRQEKSTMPDPECLANRKRWRSWAGNYLMYDTMGAAQLGLLTLFFGLRERHKLLEIGSGSLRAARFLIPYLDTGHYCGVEPNAWAVQMGIENELGEEMAARKKPRFTTREDFVFDEFGETFDYAVSYSVLTHIPPPQIQMMFDGLGRVVHDHSICLLSALTSEDERIVDPEKWTTLPCNLYSEGRLAAAAERA